MVVLFLVWFFAVLGNCQVTSAPLTSSSLTTGARTTGFMTTGNPINCNVGSCTWYLTCLEQKISCGPNGYAVAYGYYFCNRYQQSSSRLSNEGNLWKDAVMNCLQEELLPLTSQIPSPTCSEITDYAFDSHPGCYTSENYYGSVCSLGAADWFAILSITYSGLFSLRGLRQVREAMSICYHSNKAMVSLGIEVNAPWNSFIAQMDVFLSNMQSRITGATIFYSDIQEIQGNLRQSGQEKVMVFATILGNFSQDNFTNAADIAADLQVDLEQDPSIGNFTVSSTNICGNLNCTQFESTTAAITSGPPTTASNGIATTDMITTSILTTNGQPFNGCSLLSVYLNLVLLSILF